jgi:large subunit ribosomal protein L25
MGDKITLTLALRELHGKKAQQLRSQGIVPAIVYGPDMDPISTQVAYNEMERVWRRAGKHSPVQLTIDGKKKIALIKDVEIEPTKARILHVSFHAVNAKAMVTADIPIRLIGEGESEAERAGLVILQSLEKVEVRALPMDLPEVLEISIADLKEQGERITLADLTLPTSVELVEHHTGHEDLEEGEEAPTVRDLTVATVYEPSALQAANEAAGGDAEDESEVESENGSEDENAEASEDGEEKSESKDSTEASK